jgi:uncharacterized membrane protein YphA (DoxX/SURF4 family)
MRLSRVFFAAAMIALGITGFVNGDLALVWQQIPITDMPGHTVIAYVCALIELSTGIGLLIEPLTTLACRVLFPFMLLWVVLLKIPVLLSAPGQMDSWGGLGEISIITAGSWCLFAAHAGEWEVRHLGFAVGERGFRAARWLLVISLPLIGLVVLVQGATYTLPAWLAWLPRSVDWVYLSGLGSLAACCGILFGVWPRLAAVMEAAMLAVVTIWFWGPMLHTGRTATTAFLISSLIVGGVWLVSDTYGSLPWLAAGHPLWGEGTGSAAPPAMQRPPI